MNNIDNLLKNYYRTELTIPTEIDNKITNFIKNYKEVKLVKRRVSFVAIIQIICIILGLTGVCIATGYIVKEKIKPITNSTDSNGLLNGNIIIQEMEHDKTYDIYFEPIASFEKYNEISARIADIPKMSQYDFETKFLVIITWARKKEPSEKQLEIEEIVKENEKTIIKFKYNEEINDENNMLFAIGDKIELTKEVQIFIRQPEFLGNNQRKIEDLKESFYSKEKAFEDGCIVTYNSKILSDNSQKVYDFFGETYKGKESSLRIYKIENYESNSEFNSIFLIDIFYNNNIYYVLKYNVNKNLELEKVDTYDIIERMNDSNEYTGWSNNYTVGGDVIFSIDK